MNLTVVFVIGGIVLLVIAGISVFVVLGRRDKAVEERLGQFTRPDEVTLPSGEGQAAGPKKSPIGETLNRLLAGRGFADKIARDLARADLKFNVGEYLAAHVILFVAVVALIGLWQKSVIVGVIAGGISLIGPGIYVRMQQGGRLARFDNQLGDMLNLVVNGLRAGYSVMQALESIGRELPMRWQVRQGPPAPSDRRFSALSGPIRAAGARCAPACSSARRECHTAAARRSRARRRAR